MNGIFNPEQMASLIQSQQSAQQPGAGMAGGTQNAQTPPPPVQDSAVPTQQPMSSSAQPSWGGQFRGMQNPWGGGGGGMSMMRGMGGRGGDGGQRQQSMFGGSQQQGYGGYGQRPGMGYSGQQQQGYGGFAQQMGQNPFQGFHGSQGGSPYGGASGGSHQYQQMLQAMMGGGQRPYGTGVPGGFD